MAFSDEKRCCGNTAETGRFAWLTASVVQVFFRLEIQKSFVVGGDLL
jgi:hypothetical protein